MSRSVTPPRMSSQLTGRLFVHPLFDYMLIGGGLSLIVTAIVVMHPARGGLVDPKYLPYFILLSNSAHFAASTVRLYSKPDAYKTMPFATMALPLITLVVLALCMVFAGQLGGHLQSLYLTWSPYHYAAQAYGLAVMYAYRSGFRFAGSDKKLLWWVSMLPFLYNFLRGHRVGVDWFLSQELLTLPLVQDARSVISMLVMVVACAAPALYFVKTWRSNGGPMPLISMMVIVANGIWWFLLIYLDAFLWATVFHGIQYLAIVIIFHMKDQASLAGNRHGTLYHVLRFYGTSLVLGYALFNAFPFAFMLAGFGKVESALLVVATINVHHFIVDGYIWRLKKSDSNRRVVDSATVPAAA